MQDIHPHDDQDLVNWDDPFWEQQWRWWQPTINELVDMLKTWLQTKHISQTQAGISEDRLRWYAFWLAYWKSTVELFSAFKTLDPPLESEAKLLAALKKSTAGMNALLTALMPSPLALGDVIDVIEQFIRQVPPLVIKRLAAARQRKRGRPPGSDLIWQHTLAFWFHYRKPRHWREMYWLWVIWSDEDVPANEASFQRNKLAFQKRVKRMHKAVLGGKTFFTSGAAHALVRRVGSSQPYANTSLMAGLLDELDHVLLLKQKQTNNA